MRVTAALHLQMGTFSLGVCAQCPGWAGPLLSCGLRVGRTPARHCMEGIGEWSGGPEEDGCGRVCHDGGQTEGRWDPVLGFSHLRKLGLARLWCGVERVGGRRGYKVIMKSCELLGWRCCLSVCLSVCLGTIFCELPTALPILSCLTTSPKRLCTLFSGRNITVTTSHQNAVC